MRWHRFVCRGVRAASGGDQAPDGESWAGWGVSKEFSRHQLEFIFAKLRCPTPRGTCPPLRRSPSSHYWGPGGDRGGGLLSRHLGGREGQALLC